MYILHHRFLIMYVSFIINWNYYEVPVILYAWDGQKFMKKFIIQLWDDWKKFLYLPSKYCVCFLYSLTHPYISLADK